MQKASHLYSLISSNAVPVDPAVEQMLQAVGFG